MTSYRTELSGILSALYLIRSFIEFSDTALTSAPPLYCDNSASVLWTNTPISPGIREHLAADYDLYKEIATIVNTGSCGKYVFYWLFP
eukprot:10753600-Ditylum_brightwellii.AAC.1